MLVLLVLRMLVLWYFECCEMQLRMLCNANEVADILELRMLINRTEDAELLELRMMIY